MPTYEYECTVCRCRFEEYQRLTEPPLVTCPKCTGRLRRLVSAGGGIIFKGSGFYETDYKRVKKKEEKPSTREAPTEAPTKGKKPAD